MPTISAPEALERLREGNQRFASGAPRREARTGPQHRHEIVAGQEPFAIVLGCSDSRVPPEIVLDQGLGDLFVVRVAGNVVTPCSAGSIEFAALEFGVRLVLVLGHSRCGAVQASVEELQRPTGSRPPRVHSIIDCIRPSVEKLLQTELEHEPGTLAQHAVRASIRSSVHHLQHESEVLKRLIQREGLLVTGAEYSLETGLVEFLGDVPEDD